MKPTSCTSPENTYEYPGFRSGWKAITDSCSICILVKYKNGNLLVLKTLLHFYKKVRNNPQIEQLW